MLHGAIRFFFAGGVAAAVVMAFAAAELGDGLDLGKIERIGRDKRWSGCAGIGGKNNHRESDDYHCTTADECYELPALHWSYYSIWG